MLHYFYQELLSNIVICPLKVSHIACYSVNFCMCNMYIYDGSSSSRSYLYTT